MTLVPRLLIPRLNERLKHRRVVILTGARQTGKTTLVRDLLAPTRSPEPEYRTLDDPDDRARLAGDAVRGLDRPGGLVIVDEIQKLPDLFDSVKLLADRPHGTNFLLLGSSQILLMQQIRETLAGRAAFLDLWPLAVAERARDTAESVDGGSGNLVKGPKGGAKAKGRDAVLDRLWDHGLAAIETLDLGKISSDRARELRALAEFGLRWGGYPGVAALPNDIERAAWFQDYRRSFLERDLADLGKVSDLDQMAQTQVWLSERTGDTLNYTILSRDLGVAVNTAKRYTRILEISYQIVLVPPFLPRIEQRVAKNPKLFWTDVGLARALSKRTDPNDGPLFETFVASELVKWRSFRDDAPELFYFRTHGGVEVDLVLTNGKRLLGIECKASKNVHEADAGPIERFLDLVKIKDSFGVVVYRGRDVVQLKKRVWAVPDWWLVGG